jgi:hypothetical protein
MHTHNLDQRKLNLGFGGYRLYETQDECDEIIFGVKQNFLLSSIK